MPAPVADRVDGDGELLRGAGEGLDAGVGALGEEAERDVRELLNHCGEDGGRENGGGSAAGGERTAGRMRGGGCSAAEGRSDDAQLVRARTLVVQGGDELDVRLLRLGEHDGVHRAGARSAVPARSAVATLARARHDSARENPSSSASRLVVAFIFGPFDLAVVTNMGRPSRHNPRRTADERRPTGVARRARTPANVPRTRPRSAFTSGARLTQEVDRATPRPDSPVFPTPVEALHRQPWISRRRSLSPCTCGSTRSPCLGRSVTSPETSPTEVRARRDPRTPRASAPRRPLRPFDRCCAAFCRHFRALARRRARPHPPASARRNRPPSPSPLPHPSVLVAEVIAHFYPRLVELHNYSSANATTQKVYNWQTLNSRALKKLGFQIPREEFMDVCNCRAGAIERVLKLCKFKMAEFQRKHGRGGQGSRGWADAGEQRGGCARTAGAAAGAAPGWGGGAGAAAGEGANVVFGAGEAVAGADASIAPPGILKTPGLTRETDGEGGEFVAAGARGRARRAHRDPRWTRGSLNRRTSSSPSFARRTPSHAEVEETGAARAAQGCEDPDPVE